MKEFENWIKKKGFKKMFVAKELGISACYLTQLLKGNMKPSSKVADKIVQLTNAEVTYNDIYSNSLI